MSPNPLWASFINTSGNISVKVIGSVKKLCKCVYIVYEHPLCNSKEEKFENVCIKKNYTQISVRRWIRTHGHHKIITSARDDLDHSAKVSYYSQCIIIGCNFTCWQQQKLWEVGTRTHKHLGKKFWLVIVVLHMAYLILVGEHCRNGFCWGFEVVFQMIYYYIKNFRVQKIFFLMQKNSFFWIFFLNSLENLVTRPQFISFWLNLKIIYVLMLIHSAFS